MGKARTIVAMYSIVAILLFASHVLHFISPLIRMSMDDGGSIVEDGDDLTTMDFLQLASFYENYDWSNYDVNDFPDWLYMPESLPTEFNTSENGIPPFYGYDWDNYDPTDFPNWLIMPEALPTDFNSTDPEYVMEFISDHIDPEFISEMEDGMSDLADVENPEDILSGDNFDLGSMIGSIISVWELVFAIIWLVVALILFIISRNLEDA